MTHTSTWHAENCPYRRYFLKVRCGCQIENDKRFSRKPSSGKASRRVHRAPTRAERKRKRLRQRAARKAHKKDPGMADWLQKEIHGVTPPTLRQKSKKRHHCPAADDRYVPPADLSGWEQMTGEDMSTW